MSKDALKLIGIGIVALAVVWVLLDVVKLEAAQRQRWIDRCVADGNKDWECEERWKIANPAPQRVIRGSSNAP